MESPAKGDGRQGVKASQKHIEFQLQREKTYTRELEEKIKTQLAHIAKLEQDKAELRREMITLVEEEKKKTKLEERCHMLQKELAEKQTALIGEQKRVTSIECEKEQIRRDAHTSIAKWCEAEKQWIAENDALQKDLEESRDAFAKLKCDYEALTTERDDVLKQLHREKEHCSRLESVSETTEKKIAALHSRIESLQNDIYTRDETLFKLDEAGTKWQEICHSKDEEIKALEVQVAKQSDTIENLQNTISTLNQRIEATKMINMEEKCRVDKVSCDLRECEKENKLLQLELDTLRRDLDYASQNATKHQELVTDLRAKLLSSTEQMKEKNTEVRKQELIISQLTADLKKMERDRTDGSYLVNSLQTQLQSLQDALSEAQSNVKTLVAEKLIFESELQQVKTSFEVRDEAVVLMKSELEDKIESLRADVRNLESEVSERQNVINSITKQLGEANVRNEELYGKVLKHSDLSVQLRGECDNLQNERNKLCQDLLILEENVCRYTLCDEYSEMICDTLMIHAVEVTSVLKVYFGEISRLENNLKELASEKLAGENKFTLVEAALREELQLLKEREAEKANEIATGEMNIVTLEEKVKMHEETIFALKKEVNLHQGRCDELQNIEKLLSEKVVDAENLIRQMSTAAEKDVYLSQYTTKWLHNTIESVTLFCDGFCTYLSEKTDFILGEFNNLHVIETMKILEAYNFSKTSQKDTEEKCTRLLCKVSDLELRLAKAEKSFANQSEGFLIKIRSTVRERELAEKARDDALHKLKCMSEDHLIHCNADGERIKELLSLLHTEKQNRQLMEEKVQKLRKNLDYELGRKKEYKEALEEVKAKREEAERYRATEKDWAMRAIERANEEVNYWVRSFDKLKYMLDELSKRSGARVSAMDQATIKTFEEAKSRLTLRDHDVNVISQEEKNHGEKRQRKE
ncbi:BRCT domain-containing protein [Trypanosoma theileri]|uniref:BRCT domain-containing protein n=1 Tax=Trypanosoma theileri TaxID=67003 RepID=A0A1X0P2I2_9TRYP|nr:BRCT domain-containing protein [Trypanosoma theileri]ORC91154.1 BRCT domain-containing protein [Trypanosoma theileri]